MSEPVTVLIIGYGYSGQAIARHADAQGFAVQATSRDATTLDHIRSAGYEAVSLTESDFSALKDASRTASHIISTVPPGSKGDPIITGLNPGHDTWLGYLSTTGVYGDRQGGWAFEWDTPTPGQDRSIQRLKAEQDWSQLGARVFRCGGIYGPGRSAIDRLRSGRAQLIDKPGHVFSRIHVEDLSSAVVAAMSRSDAKGIFNLVDNEPTSQIPVYEEAARLTGLDLPDLQSFDDANISPMLASFYKENRRASNARAKAVLGWRPDYPSFREGLNASYPNPSVR